MFCATCETTARHSASSIIRSAFWAVSPIVPSPCTTGARLRRGHRRRCSMNRPSSKPTWGIVMLELAQVSVQYGKRPVLRGISLRLDEGEVVSLLGANAAGKTTTLRSIMGLKALSSGSILYAGEDITRLSTVERVRRGVTLAPEG